MVRQSLVWRQIRFAGDESNERKTQERKEEMGRQHEWAPSRPGRAVANAVTRPTAGTRTGRIRNNDQFVSLDFAVLPWGLLDAPLEALFEPEPFWLCWPCC